MSTIVKSESNTTSRTVTLDGKRTTTLITKVVSRQTVNNGQGEEVSTTTVEEISGDLIDAKKLLELNKTIESKGVLSTLLKLDENGNLQVPTAPLPEEIKELPEKTEKKEKVEDVKVVVLPVPEALTSKSTEPETTFSKACLDKHNHYRSLHGVEPLTVNDKLNKVAQEWADHLVTLGALSHRPKNDYGENIFWSSAKSVNGDVPVESWYNEITKYNWDKATFMSGTGHFTQVIWKGSKELGIGMASSSKGTFVVCNYNPPGNVIGHFKENVLPLKKS